MAADILQNSLCKIKFKLKTSKIDLKNECFRQIEMETRDTVTNINENVNKLLE
jgi:hypothetical protein